MFRSFNKAVNVCEFFFPSLYEKLLLKKRGGGGYPLNKRMFLEAQITTFKS